MSSITCVLEVSIFSAPVAFLPWILCVLPSAVLAVYSQNTRVRRRWTAGILLLRHWCIASPFVFFKCQKSPAFIWNIFLISSFIHKENEELSSTVLFFFPPWRCFFPFLVCSTSEKAGRIYPVFVYEDKFPQFFWSSSFMWVLHQDFWILKQSWVCPDLHFICVTLGKQTDLN